MGAVFPLTPNFLSPVLRLYWVIKYPHIFNSPSEPEISSGLLRCIASSIMSDANVLDVVVIITRSSLVILASLLASTILMWPRTSPSLRNIVCRAYTSYG
jgi:hypothetical protein